MENKLNYEDALKRLDEILASLNEDELSLERLSALYKEGLSIYHQLNELLDQTEGETSLLHPESDGTFKKESFMVKNSES